MCGHYMNTSNIIMFLCIFHQFVNIENKYRFDFIVSSQKFQLQNTKGSCLHSFEKEANQRKTEEYVKNIESYLFKQKSR